MTKFVLEGVEVVVFADGRVQLFEASAPTRTTTAELVLGWPEAQLGHALPTALRDALIERLGPTVARCKACGGVVVRREVVSSVHPGSGDGYGVVQTRCLGCSAAEEWPFSDN